jgi:hypothetical protein
MAHSTKGFKPLFYRLVLKFGFNSETLGAARELTWLDSEFQALDPGGSARDVTLPSAADDAHAGAFFVVANKADADEDLAVKEGESTVATVGQNEVGIFYVSANAWAHFCNVSQLDTDT